MTIDERLEFLLHSTESLHNSVMALTGRVEGLTGRVEGLTGRVEGLVRAAEIDAENVRRLANIAQAHERRLDNLEGH